MSALAPSSVALRGPVAQSLARGVASAEVFSWQTEALTANEQVFIANDPCRVESLTFACNNYRQRLRIYIADEEGQFGAGTELLLPRFTGQAALGLEPAFLSQIGGETSLFKLGKYDTGAAQFAIWLKEPLVCPTGLRISVSPQEVFDKGASLQMLISYFADPEAA